MSTPTDTQRMEKIVSLCKRRGFIFQSSEIYGGLNGAWDYGPLGVELKRNLKNYWWRVMVHERDDVVGMDGAILTPPAVLQASGHVEGFSDPMVECDVCKRRFRADQLTESARFYGLFDVVFLGNNDTHIGQTKCSAGGESLDDAIRKAKVQASYLQPRETKRCLVQLESGQKVREMPCCTHCGADLSKSPSRPFNLMFSTHLGATADEASIAYLRPETAQSIFVQFKNILEVSRKKLPFGIAQIGKAFRNEINPRNFTFRSREFEQMELEYFCRAEEGMKWLDHWKEERLKFYGNIGISRANLHVRNVPDEERAFYSKGTYDIEYDFPFGRQELEGVAYRTDYDLSQHQKASGRSQEYFDEETKEKFIPHVVEPSAGVDRTLLALICEAYAEDKAPNDKGEMESRIVLRFHPRMAPIKCAIFPLLKNKEPLVAKAKEIVNLLRPQMAVFYDESGAIGRRYRRQDEIGTPFGVTIDFETLGEKDPALRDTVTLRDRDSMQQERVAIQDLPVILQERIR
jgi:glycyl-tRNA synthetase